MKTFENALFIKIYIIIQLHIALMLIELLLNRFKSYYILNAFGCF